MSVELPFAPVDAIIRRNAGGLRVSADASEELARRIQDQGAAIAAAAAENVTDDGRKTIMAEDFRGLEALVGSRENGSGRGPQLPEQEDLALPIAPIDRIARLDIEERYRVGAEARLALASLLESFADEVSRGAAILARHAGRRTIQAEDIETYFALVE